ncbi:hypothetical protein [Mumia sp. DW29H23]|uniref:hypothetical protein n=1 Tax=Mumia sp. DW29H23 TaxID=3421241 RepID=UPI003D68EDCC
MGLEADYPAARVSDPADSVPIYSGRRVIAYLGPDDHFHSAATNVTCRIHRRNGTWYKLLNPGGWDPTAATAYVSAARTFLLNTEAPNPMHDCVGNTDQPGPPWWRDIVITTSIAGIGIAAAVAARRFLRERRPGPLPPPVVPEVDGPGRMPGA